MTKKNRENMNGVRQRILATAKDLFVHQGYKKTTIRQIVEESGVLTGSIYYFFKNKEDIFQSLVLSLFSQCNYLIGEHFHDESPAFRYAALCQVEFEAVRMNELVRETYYEGYTSPVIFEKVTNHLTEMTIQIFGDSLTLSREDVFLRSLLIKGAMRSYVIQFGFSTSVDAGRYSGICLRTALKLLEVDCDETDAVLKRLRERLPEIRDIANTMIHQQ